ncbi:tRNA (cytosine(34)-C(5))-methyltransferase, mitochondrial isoform X1 [Ascaphus truei]|uniref:tRNA (cytosine(34)-C(5))-methyltransferase, mitochondrial isoform X1 n=1 Tax=Ascaphus truei TaxID=8439 RepID=UPI003F5A045D
MGRLQKQVCQLVLDHFEKKYTKELGDSWTTIREVLTTPGCWQYAVLLNKFRFPLELETHLHMKGYHRLFHETLSILPETLKCYINRNPGKFPSQRHQIGKLKEYYILNASSLLPVLALAVKDGDRVLDMCAAPGGKSIALLQCASPDHLHCNEPDISRSRWLKQTLESFVPKAQMNVISTSELDGRLVEKFHPELYDKVLVDAPCSNDRSWLFSSDVHKAAARISQRKMLPIIQIGLLRSAVQALRPGGTLVYSTCTLSRAENSDVITNVLNSCTDIVPVDLSDLASVLSHEFTFASHVPHGLLVLPDHGKSWGPMYVAKLMKM